MQTLILTIPDPLSSSPSPKPVGHHTYLFRNGEGEFTSAEKYFISLYWSVYILTSIGLGDITPSNLGEYIVALVLMATSSIFWAYTIGNFCSIISTMDMHTVTFRQRMDELNYMMYDLDIPNDTRKRCRAYFHNSKRLKRVSYYHHLEQELSPELRRETKAHYYLPELKKVLHISVSFCHACRACAYICQTPSHIARPGILAFAGKISYSTLRRCWRPSSTRQWSISISQ